MEVPKRDLHFLVFYPPQFKGCIVLKRFFKIFIKRMIILSKLAKFGDKVNGHILYYMR